MTGKFGEQEDTRKQERGIHPEEQRAEVCSCKRRPHSLLDGIRAVP
jgi:hypothetical protein